MKHKMSIFRMAEFLSLHPNPLLACIAVPPIMLWPWPAAVSRGRMGLTVMHSKVPKRPFCYNTGTGQILMTSVADDYMYLLQFSKEDSMHPSLTPDKIEALDTPGFGNGWPNSHWNILTIETVAILWKYKYVSDHEASSMLVPAMGSDT